jgi:anti-sigma factor RsiW
VTCRDATEFLAAYVAGDLAPDVRGAFDRHLAVCVNCRRFLQQYEQTMAAERTALRDEDAPVPDELVRAILSSIREKS